MKFGKHQAKRALDLPEYSQYFVDYKGLKKLIKRLSAPDKEALATASQSEIEKSLQENKATFFFRLERELEKVNTFYLQKEAELKVRLNILIEKKQTAYKNGMLDSKSSVAYISLHEGFLRFRKDLTRLEDFIELSATSFSKALKKWDKRSKSHTKELYLSRQVEIQPVFHREELSMFSDLASTSILELEAWADGDTVVFESTKSKDEKLVGGVNSGRDRDDLFHEFIRMVGLCNNDQEVVQAVSNWVEQIKLTPDANERATKIFFLTIGRDAPDSALKALFESGLVNVDAVDEISGKNLLHRAATAGRKYAADIALAEKVDINAEDSTGKTPLHYACISNQKEIIALLIDHKADLDVHDKDNYSALLYSVAKGYGECVLDLINAGANVQADSAKDYVPLNLACQYGNEAIVKMLLDKNPAICTDAEGLYPLHIAARAGHFKLIPLLQPYVEIDQLDTFNGWPALCYAASEGHRETVKALIDANADVTRLDEDGLSALYYASWEGHAGCMGEIAKQIPHDPHALPLDCSTHRLQEPDPEPERKRTSSLDISETLDDMDISDIDDIPDLSLPPPIIPLRRYGHNFLDNKIVLQILFDVKENPIKLNNDEYMSGGGRLTVSTRNNSNLLIPRSVILPMTDSDRALSFQVDSLDDFALDFEIFPTFGTQIVAKTAAMPYIFNNFRPETYAADHYCKLPLFDMRLKAVGEISFRFQVVKPYAGKPLEITKYDTYWKSTSQLDNTNSSSRQQLANLTNSSQAASKLLQSVQSLSFVTASSLSGEYARIFVSLTSDGVPVVTPQRWLIDVASGVQIPIGNLTRDQVIQLAGPENTRTAVEQLSKVSHAAEVSEATCGGRYVVALEDFLRALPLSIKLDVGILYPTTTEATYSNLGPASFPELNVYVDYILKVLFDHAREVRHNNAFSADASISTAMYASSPPTSSSTRSIIFTSKHPDVCSVLNWKQPNYPVFFHMNALKLHHNSFDYQTAHAFPVLESDRRCSSVKDASAFAANNNLLGIICSSRLLGMVPTIVDAVRAMGLVLVANRDDELEHAVRGVDGTRSRTVMTFKDSIDV